MDRMNGCCEKLKACAPLFLRIGLGVIFAYHGYGKVFGDGAGFGFSWNPNLPGIVQALVAWGEFLSGAAILFGFLVEAAACNIIIIMIGAIVLVHGKNGFSLMNHGFEYNFALIMMCLALIGTGAGPCSLGCKCEKK